jgi:cyanophycinase
VPEESAAGLIRELVAAGAERAILAPHAPGTPEESRQLEADFAQATGVFFSGGDQMRLLGALTPEWRAQILARWRQGMPLAGTSAGTAALSERAFTGQEELGRIDPGGIHLVPGIGPLPNVVLDQHFILRQRTNRLLSAVLAYSGVTGVGVDEGTALVVSGAKIGRVYGPTQVVFIRAGASDTVTFGLTVLSRGQCWDFNHGSSLPCL